MKHRRWLIPIGVFSQTENAFRRGCHEVFVMWTASLNDAASDLLIRRAIVPEQRPGRTAFGVYVHIEGNELSRVQIENFMNRERAVVQLHTHPGNDVSMSDLDRQWEVVAHDGALSIIVPNYGRSGLEGFAGANIYEREGQRWRLWTAAEAATRICIQP